MSVNACMNNVQLFIKINTGFESPICKKFGVLMTQSFQIWVACKYQIYAWFTPATFHDFCCLLFGDFVTQRLWFWFGDFGRFFHVISDFGRFRHIHHVWCTVDYALVFKFQLWLWDNFCTSSLQVGCLDGSSFVKRKAGQRLRSIIHNSLRTRHLLGMSSVSIERIQSPKTHPLYCNPSEHMEVPQGAQISVRPVSFWGIHWIIKRLLNGRVLKFDINTICADDSLVSKFGESRKRDGDQNSILYIEQKRTSFRAFRIAL